MCRGSSANSLALAVSILLMPLATGVPASAQAPQGQSLEARKANYAPWSPDQMAQRRKEQGLIGPGTARPVPPPSFPSYLRSPSSVEELMPQARAAARQTGGRTPDRKSVG